VELTFGREGIHFRARALIRPFHRPFLMPWECLQSLAPHEWLHELVDYYQMELRDGRRTITLRVDRKAYEAAMILRSSHRRKLVPLAHKTANESRLARR
jgi:hypothetical protein